MELVQPQSAAERFKQANDAMSEHCFKTGRLHYKIKLDEEQLEKDKRELSNMLVDFEKLRDKFIKAQQELAATPPPSGAATPEQPIGLELT